jgi:hypothetical protein
MTIPSLIIFLSPLDFSSSLFPPLGIRVIFFHFLFLYSKLSHFINFLLTGNRIPFSQPPRPRVDPARYLEAFHGTKTFPAQQLSTVGRHRLEIVSWNNLR